MEATTSRSPARQPGSRSRTSRRDPAAAVSARRSQLVRAWPCSSTVPPMTPSTLGPMPITSLAGLRSVR
ncbi:MAG TPA: hypothetical protein VL330_17330, partial [Actinomycetes bacterium]|nr:hypothetical protein [Actinomycetes bacterium]